MKKKVIGVTTLLLALVVVFSGCASQGAAPSSTETGTQAVASSGSEAAAQAVVSSGSAEEKGLYAPDIKDEFMVGGVSWQLSAECKALMKQAFDTATNNVDDMKKKCQDPGEPDWKYDESANAMYYQGKRVAVVADIDDTLVQASAYDAWLVARDKSHSNVAYAEFIMSDSCIPTPGSVEFVKYCLANGIEVFYVTNRADEDKDGNTPYKAFGKTVYDISIESMTKLGFPIDDQHLIVNDPVITGSSSKESARQAIANGNEAFPNGQRESNSSGTSLTAKIAPHHIAMLMGDNLNDLTDAFSGTDLNADTRAQLIEKYADKFGNEWIVLPNAMYGDSYTFFEKYGMTKLLEEHSYK
ncbi:MAG: hypothetical protein IK152_10430 [Lachnospiraceae bacterium]|nr:hypothetical protein [Lachnospiraceae bacterium]